MEWIIRLLGLELNKKILKLRRKINSGRTNKLMAHNNYVLL